MAKYETNEVLVNWYLLMLPIYPLLNYLVRLSTYQMTTPALQARVHKLLGSCTELKATTSLLSTLVKVDGTSLVQLDTSVNTETSSLATLRRTLRSSLEMQQLSLAQKALDGYEQTLEQASNLATQVNELDAKCAQIVDFLAMTKMETQQMQSEAAAIAKNRCVLFLTDLFFTTSKLKLMLK